ncbi:phage protein [Vibrio sonorensis]|uniref:phage protein n=1 Tax=Vibrio sonorensis TaxID=1004316 RepID=UPI0008DACE3E|nr:phage protein [Vibrio sonorensis]
MKYREMTKNYIFRELECQLSKEEAAKLCFKTVRTITSWDKGKPIPKECRRLMRLYRQLEISHLEEWEGFAMKGSKMLTPTGQLASPQQILTGLALLEIQSELELKTTRKLLSYARVINRIGRNH